MTTTSCVWQHCVVEGYCGNSTVDVSVILWCLKPWLLIKGDEQTYPGNIEKPVSKMQDSLESVACKKVTLENSICLSPNKGCVTARSASCPLVQSLPHHLLVCSARCKAEWIPPGEVTGSTTRCWGEEFPYILLHVCWAFFRGKGDVWALGSFTLQVKINLSLFFMMGGWRTEDHNGAYTSCPVALLWCVEQVIIWIEGGMGPERSYMKISCGLLWKMGSLKSLCRIALEDYPFHVSTAAMCFVPLG